MTDAPPGGPERTLAYRPEIDGLRGVAVLLVILYHVGIPPFSGGFIGVDVFFVISGFLITGIIRSQVERGVFSFRRFYVRRFKRLIPASIAVILASSLLALLLFSPETLGSQLRMAIASAFSLANIQLWREVGYFDAASSTKPLLHMWSLGVEEQFYLLWPAALYLAFRYGGQRVALAVIAVVSVLSMVACVMLTRTAPSTAFYLTPFRMFEFGAGALLLWLPTMTRGRLGTVAGSIGLAGLLALTVTLTGDSTFPGWNAVWVTLATALVILGSRSAPVWNVLGSRPLVQVGVLSYSLYLVHWPILVFYTFIVYRSPTVLDKGVMLALTAVCALALYRYVERPLRAAPLRGSLRVSLPVGLLYAAVLVLAVLGIRAQGWPARVTVDGVTPLTPTQMLVQESKYCAANDPQPFVTCATSENDATSVYVWGDSHARHLIGGLATTKPDTNVKILYETACFPLLGITSWPYDPLRAANRKCAARNEQALTYFKSAAPTIILLSARWRQYLTTEAQVTAAVPLLRTLVGDLQAQGHRVVVVGNVIEPGVPPINCLLAPDWPFAPRARCVPSIPDQQASLDLNRQLAAVGPEFFDPASVFCREGECRIRDGQALLYRDTTHLTERGATALVTALEAAGRL